MKLVLANEQQKIERDRLTYSEWGDKLTLHQWLAREERLRAHAWSKQGMKTWLLVDASGGVLSSCETFRMRSVFNGAPGLTFGIASVFTEEKLRGKGYARKLVAEVVDALVSEHDVLHSVILFSEVGEKVYQAAGFVSRPSFERHFLTTARRSGASNVKALGAKELLAAWPSLYPPKAGFLVWPTSEQLDWHFERERVYAELLNKNTGATKAAALAFGDALITWMVNYKQDALQALYFQARTALEAQALLVKACELACELGLSKLIVWESEAFSGWDRLGIHGERVERADTLAMIRPVDRALEPSQWSVISRAAWI